MNHLSPLHPQRLCHEIIQGLPKAGRPSVIAGVLDGSNSYCQSVDRASRDWTREDIQNAGIPLKTRYKVHKLALENEYSSLANCLSAEGLARQRLLYGIQEIIEGFLEGSDFYCQSVDRASWSWTREDVRDAEISPQTRYKAYKLALEKKCPILASRMLGGNNRLPRLEVFYPVQDLSVKFDPSAPLFSRFQQLAPQQRSEILLDVLKEGATTKVHSPLYRQAANCWIQNNAAAASVINSLEGENVKALLDYAAREGLPEIFKSITQCKHFQEIPQEKLLATCKEAAENGRVEIIRGLFDSPRLNEILQLELLKTLEKQVFNQAVKVWELRRHLEDDLNKAGQNGRVEILRMLLNDPAFQRIDSYKLGQPLMSAAQNGDAEIVRLLMNYPRFNDIPLSYLSIALTNAAEKGHVEIVRLLINCPRFKEFRPHDLEFALNRAAENGHVKIVQLLLDCPGSATISPDKLTWPFHEAALKGHLEVVQAFMKWNHFAKIQRWGYTVSLHFAVQKGHVEIFRLLIACSYFKEIELNDLRQFLQEAAENGHVEIVRLLIQCPRFNDIPPRDLGRALSNAAENGHVGAVQTLIQSSRFPEISSQDLKNIRAKVENKEIRALLTPSTNP